MVSMKKTTSQEYHNLREASVVLEEELSTIKERMQHIVIDYITKKYGRCEVFYFNNASIIYMLDLSEDTAGFDKTEEIALDIVKKFKNSWGELFTGVRPALLSRFDRT